VSSPGPLANRILSRLEQAESNEQNPHFQTDYRIAWITVLNAARGEPEPFLWATLRVLGCPPAEVWPRIVAERRRRLGPLYEQFFGEDRGVLLPPKKPPVSVRSLPQRADRAA